MECRVSMQTVQKVSHKRVPGRQAEGTKVPQFLMLAVRLLADGGHLESAAGSLALVAPLADGGTDDVR